MIGKRHLALLITALIDIAVVVAAAPDYILAGDVFFFLLAVKAWIFVGLYGFRSNWRATAAGRAVMGLVACIALICTQATLTIIFGLGFPGRAAVRLILIGSVGITLMNLLLTLVAAQRRGGVEE
ncbi:putative phage holin [Nocardia africana]